MADQEHDQEQELVNDEVSTPTSLGDRWSNLENYVMQNKQRVSYIGIAIALVIAGYIAYNFWYLPGQEQEAEVAIFPAQRYFGIDSINKAIPIFQQVADDYGATKIGHTANYYLGVCYFRKKDYQKAIDYLDKFNAGDIMVTPIAAGLMGDAEMQLGHTDAALDDYLKAVKKSDNELTAPIFLKKAALACEMKKDYAQALSLYENIKTEYHSSQEASDIDKYIARAKVLSNSPSAN